MKHGGSIWNAPSRRRGPTNTSPQSARRLGVILGAPTKTTGTASHRQGSWVVSKLSYFQANRVERSKICQGSLEFSGEDMVGLVRRRTVEEQTGALYTNVSSAFLADMAMEWITWVVLFALDRKLDIEAAKLYFAGGSRQQARYLVYAVCWALALKASSLSLAKASLKGISRSEPDVARSGVMFKEVLLIAEYLHSLETIESCMAATALLLEFDSYQCPATVLCVKIKNIHAPSTIKVTDPLRSWTIMLFPTTVTVLSKSRTQDDTVDVGASAVQLTWATPVCEALAVTSGRDGPQTLMFRVCLPAYRSLLTKATSHLKWIWLPRFCCATKGPRTIRPAGPLLKPSTFEASRGTKNSCARYFKFGRYVRRRSSLSASMIKDSSLALARHPPEQAYRPARSSGEEVEEDLSIYIH